MRTRWQTSGNTLTGGRFYIHYIGKESWFWSQANVGTNGSSIILAAVDPTGYLNFLSLDSFTDQRPNFTSWGHLKMK